MTKTHEQWLQIFQGITGGYICKDIETTVSSGAPFVESLKQRGVIHDGDWVLDMGCGNGRLAIAFSQMLMTYVGFDVSSEAMDFCKQAFAEYPRMSFFHIDGQNDTYNPNGAVDPLSVRFPDGPFDTVIAISVFTHLKNIEICSHYMGEVRRVLRPGGKFFSTWFRSPPQTFCEETEKTVLHEADIINLFKEFHIEHTQYGHTDGYHDQWHIDSVYLPRT